jgi:hypothetical protein
VESLARNLKQAVLIEYTRKNFATPVMLGEVFGTMTYYPGDGGSAIVYDLVASRSVLRRANAPRSIEEIEAETYADPNPFPPLSPELLALILGPFAAIYVLVRVLMRIFHRGGGSRSGKKNRVPRPGNRYFR